MPSAHMRDDRWLEGKWHHLGHLSARSALTSCAGETAEREVRISRHTATHRTIFVSLFPSTYLL